MVWPNSGCLTFAPSAASIRWAKAAYEAGSAIAQDPEQQRRHLRHGNTWFVGVDALPNDAAGQIGGAPFDGPWAKALPWTGPLHRAQLSIIYPGYPVRDAGQSEANHRFRADRFAAHMDGLLPEGPERRRFAREFHAYILGIHLNACDQAPDRKSVV